MSATLNLQHVSIVLYRPRYPENIGATARAMRNMGLERLVVVGPQDCDLTRILKMATHGAVAVVEEMEVYDDLQTAVAPFNYVVGTTARLGGQRKLIGSPAELAVKLASIAVDNRVALLFGPEDRGLTNEDIRFCHELVNIPTAEFSSLNLAQAVMIMCYELRRYSHPGAQTFLPRLATRHELDGMYAQLKDVLMRINYIQPDNPDYFMNNIRQLGTRMQLRAKDVSTIRGICRQIDWYGRKCYQKGLKNSRE